jgi:hypothetical protein
MDGRAFLGQATRKGVALGMMIILAGESRLETFTVKQEAALDVSYI